MAIGLVHVDALHDAFGDLLELPKAQGKLSGTGGNVDRLLYSPTRTDASRRPWSRSSRTWPRRLPSCTDATGRAWIRPCGATPGRQGACTPCRRGQIVCQPSLAPENPRRWPRQRDGGGGDGAADGVGMTASAPSRDQRGLLFATAPRAWRDIYWLPNSTLVVAILCCSGAPLCSSSPWPDGKNGLCLTHT
ncbi:hypothetical protein ZWY2020_053764 [Hordeum vulgare]|nr:hypothetical protein ZWY2020_053764 [Hordeum vulgare]